MKKSLMIIGVIASCCALISCGDDISVVISSPEDLPATVSEVEESPDEGMPIFDESPIKSLDWEEMANNQEGDADTLENEESEALEDARIKTITISAAGDVTMGNYVGQDYSWSFMQTWDKTQDVNYFFENVQDIFSQDDLTLVNLEGVLTNAQEHREEQTYCISGKPEFVKILTAGSIEAVSMANNHRYDYFERGTKDTVTVLEEEGIVYAYDDHYGIYEINDIRVGYVSVNQIGMGSGVEKYIKEGIEYLQEESVDLILICCHWGIERENYPNDYQQSLGKKCIDWGADLVIGHHPHVIQGIEEYQGKYIIYSLGNFCFGANRNPTDKDCIIFQQTFTFDNGIRQDIKDARIIPCSVSSVSERNDYKPTVLMDQQKERILERMNTYSEAFGVRFDSDGRIN